MNKYNANKLFHTTENIGITSPYGYRKSPINGKDEFHEGVDYSANGKSIPIYALDDGEVLAEGYDNTKAIFCYVRYPKLDDYVGMYYHLANTVINKGDKVNKNTKLGMMGATGNVTGIHLHFNWFKYSDYNKGFYQRNYEDFDKYVFPENRVKITEPVERDESKSQLKVLADNLRVRTGHSTNDSAIGFVEKDAIYNDLEVFKDDTYTWHKIAEEQWIADNGEWLELYEVIDYKGLLDENKQLKEENTQLHTEIEQLHKTNEEICNRIIELQQTNQKLNDEIIKSNNKLKEINRISTL